MGVTSSTNKKTAQFVRSIATRDSALVALLFSVEALAVAVAVAAGAGRLLTWPPPSLMQAVHLTDVNPRFGPVSGGTRLYLSGSNLNIGSRIQIFLDEIPCSIDSPPPSPSSSNYNNDANSNHQQNHYHSSSSSSSSSSNQISCITAPNLLASSMRITKLTLMIDNSTHHLPYPFSYQPDPIITSIEPAESFIAGGRLILVMGQHLASPQSTKLMVYHEHKHNIVNATSCITQNDTLITCLTPAISRELLFSSASSSSSHPNKDLSLYKNQNDDNDSTGAAGAYGNNNNRDENNDNDDNDNDGDDDDDDDYRQSILSYQSGGLKLKMSLIMDDVKSVRNLDEYYHHLPHYLTYYENPQLFRLQPNIVDFIEGQDLNIQGENLQMKQLDQDMLITIGSNQYVCIIKSIAANQVSCEPPKKIAPVRDEHGLLMERPLMPIIALIGSNLRFNLGFMRYNSKLHYQQLDQQQLIFGSNIPIVSYPSQYGHGHNNQNQNQNQNHNSEQFYNEPSVSASGLASSPSSLVILIILSIIGFVVFAGFTLMFALTRLRQSKAEREYKRIQLQIGLLDINGQPTLNSGGGLIFDKRLNYVTNATSTPTSSPFHHHHQHHQQQQHHNNHPAHRRALDYIGSLSSKKLLQQLTSGHHNQAASSFPPSSPFTDISSLAGGNLLNNFNNQFGNNQQHLQHQQHVIKLTNNGTISNSTYSSGGGTHTTQHIYSSANPSSLSSQSSPGSTRDQQQQPLVGGGGGNGNQGQQQFNIDGVGTLISGGGGGANNNLISIRDSHHHHQQQLQNTFHQSAQLMKNNDKSQSLLLTNNGNTNTASGGGGNNSRNFNWTQDAPSTIVPYAVIEACNLTLDEKNQPMKEFV